MLPFDRPFRFFLFFFFSLSLSFFFRGFEDCPLEYFLAVWVHRHAQGWTIMDEIETES